MSSRNAPETLPEDSRTLPGRFLTAAEALESLDAGARFRFDGEKYYIEGRPPPRDWKYHAKKMVFADEKIIAYVAGANTGQKRIRKGRNL